MFKPIRSIRFAVAVVSLAAAAQAQAGSALLTDFSQGPRSRYCGSVSQDNSGCLPGLGESAAPPVVTAEFYVGRIVEQQATAWQGASHWQADKHDMGRWLSQGKGHADEGYSYGHGGGHWNDSWHKSDPWHQPAGDNGMGSVPDCDPSPVPLPGGVWLLASGLLGLVVLRRRNPFES